jgi:6-pyruvoyl-tetrahydropterin synthase
MACLFVEQLTVLDFSRLDRERGLVGESWIVDLELEGDLDHQSMVLDFGEVKRVARQAVEACADHRLLVPTLGNAVIAEAGGLVRVTWRWGTGRSLEVGSPAGAFAFVPSEQVDPATLRPILVEAVGRVVPANVRAVRISLREEDRPGHYYHYSHGLKRHQGLCQRIAHGHRSRIEIWKDGARAPDLERAWAERWRDIYLGSEDDLVGGDKDAAGGRIEFAYEAPEGRFELAIDRACCEVVPSDSTVECLAAYIAGELAREAPGHRFRVRAYEGVNKGAAAGSG